MALLHGTEREICWLDMLLVKDPLCSKQRGTFCSKDMLWVEASLLHGTDREICWIHVLFCSKMKGTDREICSTDMLLVGASLFHGSEREICWIVTLQKGTKREFSSTDMLWPLFITRNGTWNLLNRYAIYALCSRQKGTDWSVQKLRPLYYTERNGKSVLNIKSPWVIVIIFWTDFPFRSV